MNKYRFVRDGHVFVQVDKAIAKNAFIDGVTVAFCPFNVLPGTFKSKGFMVNREDGEFDDLLDVFEYYMNTNLNQYTIFFVETGKRE